MDDRDGQSITMVRGAFERQRDVLDSEGVPCGKCKYGIHRLCTHPVTIPTILSYLRGKKYMTSETLTCCDRKEFWTRQVFT